MIFHLVLLKVRPTATPQEVENLYKGLNSLTEVPGVKSVSCGPVDKCVYAGYDDRSKGYTHALLVLLKDKAALEGYDKNSFHAVVKSTIIKPMLDTTVTDPVLAVDWEGPTPHIKTCWFSQLVTSQSMTMFAAGALAVAGIVVMRSRL
jgi:hypothetical protein